MLSNLEIWNGNNSLDDSKNFIENYKEMAEKKKKDTKDQNKSEINKKKNMSKKPNHLMVII